MNELDWASDSMRKKVVCLASFHWTFQHVLNISGVYLKPVSKYLLFSVLTVLTVFDTVCYLVSLGQWLCRGGFAWKNVKCFTWLGTFVKPKKKQFKHRVKCNQRYILSLRVWFVCEEELFVKNPYVAYDMLHTNDIPVTQVNNKYHG